MRPPHCPARMRGQFKALLSASAYIAAFTFAAYLGATLSGEGEPVEDGAEPDFLFDTPQDALKSA